MITWGGTILSVVWGTWQPCQSQTQMVETLLLPDPADPSAVCSVLQQQGRQRLRVTATLILYSQSAYNTLLSDMVNCTSRILYGGSTVNASYMIEALGAIQQVAPYQYRAAIKFVEAV